jgi:hypothetical protein
MSKNFSLISQVLSSSALEQKKHFEAILPRPALHVIMESILWLEVVVSKLLPVPGMEKNSNKKLENNLIFHREFSNFPIAFFFFENKI